jgi:phosphoglycolate phosphatase
MKLVLFDIDGTVLLSDGAGKRAVRRAMVEVFGTPGPDAHRFDGKTDPQIVRELQRLAGHPDRHIDEHLPRAIGRYVELLSEELDRPGHKSYTLPGVPELLDALEARDDVLLGLLTGNVLAGARAKLAAVGIDPDRFAVLWIRPRDSRGAAGDRPPARARGAWPRIRRPGHRNHR